jgi:hypothetical protein
MSAMSAKFPLSLTPTKWLLLLSLAAALLFPAFNATAQSYLGLPLASVSCLVALTIFALGHFKIGDEADEWALRFYLWFFCMLCAGSFASTSIPVEVGPLAWITAKGNHVSYLQAAFVALQQVLHVGLVVVARRADRQEADSMASKPFTVIPGPAIDFDALWPCHFIVGDQGDEPSAEVALVRRQLAKGPAVDGRLYLDDFWPETRFSANLPLR